MCAHTSISLIHTTTHPPTHARTHKHPSTYSHTPSGGECGVAAARRFHMPSAPSSPHTAPFWYSFDYGSVHFTVISTEHDITHGSVQRAWLEGDLAAVDRWAGGPGRSARWGLWNAWLSAAWVALVLLVYCPVFVVPPRAACHSAHPPPPWLPPACTHTQACDTVVGSAAAPAHVCGVPSQEQPLCGRPPAREHRTPPAQVSVLIFTFCSQRACARMH